MMVLPVKESKVKGADKLEKASKEEQSSDVENGFNGAVETVEEGSDLAPDDAAPTKKGRKPAKTKNKELSTDEEIKPKDLPAKRGRKAKIENGDADSAIEEITNEADVEVKDLPRSSRRKAAEVKPANSVKEQNKPEPKDTKAKSNKKEVLQAEDDSVEKEAPSKRAGRKKKPEPEKGKDEKQSSVDENRHLRVALKRNQNIDEMAKDMVENEVAEESKSNKKGGKVEKASKKGQSNDVENDLKEVVGTEEEGSDLPPNDKASSKKGKKPAKIKTKEESADEEIKPKDLPAKRGRKAKTEAMSAIEANYETDADVKDLPRSSKRLAMDGEPGNSVKQQSMPKQTKAKSNKKATMQVKENSVEKEPPSKGARGKKKTESAKDKDETHSDIGENRHLRVSLKRHQSLDKMAMEMLENEAETMETDEEPIHKTAKGSAKGKGKRTAKEPSEDSKSTKKPKEDTSKSKSGAKKEKIPDVTALDFANESKTADGKPWNLKIATWNVNGVRAWLEKNGMSYLHHEKPDILCIQETKCSNDKLPPEVNKVEGYHCYWLAGDKDGYSGVGLLSKEKPISVQYGINIEKHDNEGRVITAEYDEFYLVTTYIPNSGRGLVRLDYRQEWDKDFRAYLQKLDEKKPVVLCGDLNVAHEEIDLANPKSNKKTAGFTKEEREGFSTLLSEGFIDTFRHLYPDKTGAYTFWTYMMNARAKNVGWRLDYFVISKRFVDHLCDSVIRKDVYGSDHCPIALFLNV